MLLPQVNVEKGYSRVALASVGRSGVPPLVIYFITFYLFHQRVRQEGHILERILG